MAHKDAGVKRPTNSASATEPDADFHNELSDDPTGSADASVEPMTGVQAALFGAGALAALAAYAWAQFHHEEGRQTDCAPPDVIADTAALYEFFRNGEQLPTGPPSFEAIHSWANILNHNWTLLDEQGRNELRAMPATWRDVQAHWGELTTKEKKRFRAAWLPDLPLHPEIG